MVLKTLEPVGLNSLMICIKNLRKTVFGDLRNLDAVGVDSVKQSTF